MLCHHADFERVKTVIFDEVLYSLLIDVLGDPLYSSCLSLSVP